MMSLAEICRYLVEEVVDRCVELSARYDENKTRDADIIATGIDDKLQAELTRRNNLINGVGCVIVTHHQWTSDDDEYDVPVHTQKIYELYDGVHIHNGQDDRLSWSDISLGSDRQSTVQDDLPEYVPKERSVELIGVEFMSGEIWSAKYSKRKRGFFKRCGRFFKKLFCCCSAQDD